MIESIIQRLLPLWPAIAAVALILHLVRNHFNHGLHKHPGPVLARYTDSWRFFDVLGRRPDVTQLALHRKHGSIVRLGPNNLSFSSPSAIKTIYGLNKGFVKSGFYPPQQATSDGKRLPSLFSTTDEGYHATLRRCVNNAFAMSTLVQYEPQVNEVVEAFLRKTEEIYLKGPRKICDFAEWLQFFAFDVIGQITYSKPHGFVEQNKDIDGMIRYLGRLFGYVGPVGQMPWLDLLLLKNPVLLWLDAIGFKPFAFPIATFAKARMAEKLSFDVAEKSAEEPNQRADLLTMFLKAQADRPDFMTDQRVLTMAVSMAFAGSETTAISLAAVFYYLLKDPNRLEKLRHELDEALHDGRISPRTNGTVTWSESQTLPYLDACIKEALRMHPAVGLPLERITPPQGVEIDNTFVPGGTIVGCNAWVIHKDPVVFGRHFDVDSYVPERWLDADPTHLKEMNATMFQFGAGARTCIGKNISLLEIYKLVPAFLLRFDVEFAEPRREWRLFNAWFVKQHDFNVIFARRTSVDGSDNSSDDSTTQS